LSRRAGNAKQTLLTSVSGGGYTGNSIFFHGSRREHGLAHEGEDIRTMAPGLSEAMAEIVAGAVNTGPALTSLLWLAANRDQLRPERGELGVEAERPSH